MTVLFAHPNNQMQAAALAQAAGYALGELEMHAFPDGESLVQIKTDVAGQAVLLFCSLDQPDNKAMMLLFFAQTARELGATSVGLIAPYLGYMRQDKRFHAGEAVTSNIFAGFVSQYFDHLVTIDPHLHRHKTMAEVYTIPATALHAAGAMAGWINANVDRPVLIGPDEESGQWVSDVATRAGAAYTVLTKIRRGDKDVEVSVPHVEQYKDHTPVLVDDIISTARTMIDAAGHLLKAGMRAPVCVGVHAVFADDGYQALQAAGVGQIATCNTIPHTTNAIDMTDLLAHHLRGAGGQE